MICPNCRAELAEGKKFCGKCGTAAGLPSGGVESHTQPCPQCGHRSTKGKKFCAACGSPLQAEGITAQAAAAVTAPVRSTTPVAVPLEKLEPTQETVRPRGVARAPKERAAAVAPAGPKRGFRPLASGLIALLVLAGGGFTLVFVRAHQEGRSMSEQLGAMLRREPQARRIISPGRTRPGPTSGQTRAEAIATQPPRSQEPSAPIVAETQPTTAPSPGASAPDRAVPHVAAPAAVPKAYEEANRNAEQPLARTAESSSRISTSQWKLKYVDSQETRCGNGSATNSFDGNSGTGWHTQWCPSSSPLPHEIQIDLGASYALSAFEYLPRQDGCANGWIKQYEFYVSADGVSWGAPAATGTFDYGDLSTSCPLAGVQGSGYRRGAPQPFHVALHQATGQYIRLRALTEVNGNPYTSAAEIGVWGEPPVR